MKQNLLILMGAMFILATAGGAQAEDMSRAMNMEDTGHDIQQMESAGGDMDEMDHSGHSGELIHSGDVDGYRFAYHLIDIREKMAAMKAAGHMHEGMDATHHLMVYLDDPKGVAVGNATVGYLVDGPDGSTQKLMCMGMGGGYGSDVNLEAAGEYVVKIKVLAGEVKLVDGFTYTVE
jgi:hypothetical protein